MWFDNFFRENRYIVSRVVIKYSKKALPNIDDCLVSIM